jgi:hypothetical protein
MAANRRVASRALTCVAVGVEVKKKQQLALIRDASTSGALLFTRKPLPVGEKMTIAIQFEARASAVEVLATVVRSEQLNEGFWSYAIAVVFEPPRNDLKPLFIAMAEQQERLFGANVPLTRK